MKQIVIHELSLTLEENEGLLKEKVARKLGVSIGELEHIQILRKSLDARKKDNIVYKYSVVATLGDRMAVRATEQGFAAYKASEIPKIEPGTEALKGRIVIVGAGPAGLLAAHTLATAGYQPLLLEKGEPIEARKKAFQLLQEQGILNEKSNACFGEGGAGAFSDGKLTARNKDPNAMRVLNLFVKHGAPKEITYLAKPHLGTEYIQRIVSSVRKEIEVLGGQVIFGATVIDFLEKHGQLTQIAYEKEGVIHQIDTNACILATGHSARKTYELLEKKEVEMQAKAFAMGVRIEHARALIDMRQYGKHAGHPALGAAEYVLKTQINGRGVYSFCMCPGGEIICSATEEGHTAVNGMSYYGREMPFSNSALVVTVGVQDFPTGGALAGMKLQREIEHRAFLAAEGYGAITQRYQDFVQNKASKEAGASSYKPYTKAGNLRKILPAYIGDSLAAAGSAFERKIPGFVQEGMLIGTETRTSSPVRILRDAAMQASIRGLYPVGEGAGYAGGIMSSAIDGLRGAQAIIGRFGLPK